MKSENETTGAASSEVEDSKRYDQDAARQIFEANERLVISNRQLEKSIALAEKLTKTRSMPTKRKRTFSPI